MSTEKTVWKYDLEGAMLGGWFEVEMPVGAKILLVDVQNSPMMWAQVTPANEKRKRWFRIVGTGRAVPEDGAHVGSFTHVSHGAVPPLIPGVTAFVWHLYEKCEHTED